jgi:acyl-CoA hydrolase
MHWTGDHTARFNHLETMTGCAHDGNASVWKRSNYLLGLVPVSGLSFLSASEKTPSQSSTTVIRIMMPMDANVAGNVFGGTILRLIDEVASIVAFKHARRNVVTASIDRMDFYSPVYIGDMLRFSASINYVHKTSMEIGVRVEAENPLTGEVRHTGTCFLTYVALDKNGKPALVPKLVPETEEEKRRWAEAEARRKLRLQQIGRRTD